MTGAAPTCAAPRARDLGTRDAPAAGSEAGRQGASASASATTPKSQVPPTFPDPATLAREAADASARKRKAADGGEAGPDDATAAAAPIPHAEEDAAMGDVPHAAEEGAGAVADPNPSPSLGGCSDPPVSVELSVGGDYYQRGCCGEPDLDIPEGPKLPYVGDKEHILETQDKAEVDRIMIKIEQCKKTLLSLGYIEFTFEDFFSVCPMSNLSSFEPLPINSENSTQFVTSGEIQRRSEFFEPFISGLTNSTVAQFCKASVEPMGEESDHVHIIALSDALGVPIRVMYLDRSSCDTGNLSVNHHDFIPSANVSEGDGDSATTSAPSAEKPYITLLYRPGHYDILYPK
ncbi:hypothetical protein HU200_061976 [Digitaria exilis]|uniref:Uncharacterized protein n=1 Tax=Digitaria exilis TaxID=1010633 RepID=A0A835E073_9POAL|nr:hypothetical protein HU200_061976 [Digitaria exilis]